MHDLWRRDRQGTEVHSARRRCSPTASCGSPAGTSKIVAVSCSRHRRIGIALAPLPAVLFVTLAFLLPVGILLAGSVSTPAAAGASAAPRLLLLAALSRGRSGARCASVRWSRRLGRDRLCRGARDRRTCPSDRQGPLIGLLILPLMISPVARTYAWIVILGRTGTRQSGRHRLGLSDEPLRLLFTETAVFIGLVQLFLPLWCSRW